MKMIEPKQTQLIHIAKTQCGLSDVEYRDLLAGQTKDKKTSSSDLTYPEADAVINYFVKTLGFKIKINPSQSPFKKGRSYKNNSPFSKGGHRGILPGNVTFLPSHDQLKLIDDLAEQVTWKFADGFQRWLSKYIKTDKVRTSAQAQRAIEGLKGMLANQENQNQIPSPLRGEGQGEGECLTPG